MSLIGREGTEVSTRIFFPGVQLHREMLDELRRCVAADSSWGCWYCWGRKHDSQPSCWSVSGIRFCLCCWRSAASATARKARTTASSFCLCCCNGRPRSAATASSLFNFLQAGGFLNLRHQKKFVFHSPNFGLHANLNT